MRTLARRRSTTARALLACTAAIAFAACGGPPRPDGPQARGDGCDLLPATDPAARAAPAAADRQPVVVGMPGRVDPANAPVPRNAAERLVFPQLYETLVRVACDGRIEPALAAGWRSDDGGRVWTFTLRAGARDWTGAPVSARDVAESWLASPDAPGPPPSGPAAPRLASLTVLDARTLRARVEAPVPLHWFARPELAVRTAARTGGWPAGTGPLVPETRAPDAGRLQRIVLRPAGGGAAVEFRTLPDDPRNALDAGVDLIATRDPAVADYAAASGAFHVLPLAWDRAYVLLSRAAAGVPEPAGAARAPAASGRPHAPRIVLPPDSVLRALARDAVRADARPAAASFAGADTCGAAGGWGVEVGSTERGSTEARAPAGGGVRDGRGSTGRAGGVAAAAGGGAAAQAERVLLLYPPDDAVARALAERLVALAPEAGRPGTAWLAEAAPELVAAGAQARAGTVGRGEGFASVLRRGAGPFVVRVDRVPGMDACGALAGLVAAAPWLGGEGEADVPDATAPGDARGTSAAGGGVARIVPLVETRPVLLVRRGVAGVAVDGRGALLLGRLRRAGGGGP